METFDGHHILDKTLQTELGKRVEADDDACTSEETVASKRAVIAGKSLC